MPLFKLVLRYLFSGKPTTRFATYTALLGTFFATLSTLLTVGIMNGFEESVKKNLLAHTPHVTAYLDSRREVSEFLRGLKDFPSVEDSQWYATFPAILQKGKYLADAVILGTGEGFVKKILSRQGVLFSGNFTSEGLILGNLLASRLGIYQTPSTLNVISPTASLTPVGFLPKIKRVKESGIYSTGEYFLDISAIGDFDFLIRFL
jgi:lipoprotein-releasing system permease protein